MKLTIDSVLSIIAIAGLLFVSVITVAALINNFGHMATPAAGKGADGNQLAPPATPGSQRDAVYIALNDTRVQDTLAGWASFRLAGVSEVAGKPAYEEVSFVPGTVVANQTATAVVDTATGRVVDFRYDSN